MEITKQQLHDKITAFIDANRENYVKDLAHLLSFRSVQGPAAPGAPFGPEVRDALLAAQKMADGMGFATHNCEGYMVYADLPGQEEGHIATITHLDVVPEGNGWNSDPYTLVEKDGWLIARGTADDKGPALLTLYMAKFFRELGVPLRYGLRILLGGNEETGMEDVDYYLQNYPQPLFCFSPDAEFPVSYGEKGLYSGDFISAPLTDGKMLAFNGGIAGNVVPDRAACLLKADPAALPAAPRITITEEDGHALLSAQGIGGHAAMPENTLNAIGLLVNYLLDNRLCAPAEESFLQLLRRLHSVTDGSGLGIACRDDVFQGLTCIGGTIKLEDGRLTQNINIRFPTTITSEELTGKLSDEAAAAGAVFTAARGEKPFYIDPDSPLVQTLLSVYNEVTGENGKAFTMGGGTYARHFANAVSYGPEKPGLQPPAFVGDMHGANEGANLENLMEALRIYILAVWRLQEIDF